MADRNYINFFISDLGELARKNQADGKMLLAILAELEFRKQSQARKALTDEIGVYLSRQPKSSMSPCVKAKSSPQKHTIKELNDQSFTPTTLLKDVRLPATLQNLQRTLLCDDAQLSLKALLAMDTGSGHPKDLLLRLQLFCRQRMPKKRVSSKPEDEVDPPVKPAPKPVAPKENQIEISGRFYTTDVPNLYRRTILDTTHIHNFRKEGLQSALSSGLRGNDAAIIRSLIVLFQQQAQAALPSSGAVDDAVLPVAETMVIDAPPSVAQTQDVTEPVQAASGGAPAVNYETLIAEINAGQGRSAQTACSTHKTDFYQAGLDRCIILSAPPGCGKTYSIVERLANHAASLPENWEAKGILVLSFTRNAVKELKTRLGKYRQHGATGNLDLIRVMTFDALAWNILSASETSQPDDDFDSNIRRAKSLIIQGKSAEVAVLNNVKWIYVDEYQDLVGCRADFVIELMKLVLTRHGAVSLLGDPCQQIMNFQLKHRNDTTSENFLLRFKKLAGKQLMQINLSESYRFITAEQKARVSKLTAGMTSSQVSEINSSEYAQPVSLEAIQQGDAVLCQRNIDCYLVAEALTQRGYSVRLQAGGEKTETPLWLYRLFAGWHQETMSVALFQQKCQSVLGNDGEQALHYLSRLGVVANHHVHVARLVQISETYSAVPPVADPHQVVVSTVHKAKGLQFPRVFFYGNKTVFPRENDAMSLFYVAVTRAEKHFALLQDDAIKSAHASPGGVYKVDQRWLIEGMNEIDLHSLLPEPETLRPAHLDALVQGQARFFVGHHDAQLWLYAEFDHQQVIRLYRMPRLEKIHALRHHTRYRVPTQLAEMSTFVYAGTSAWLEKILGPTCFLPLPVLKGLWEIQSDE